MPRVADTTGAMAGLREESYVDENSSQKVNGVSVTLDLTEIAQGYGRRGGEDGPEAQTLLDVILTIAASQVLEHIDKHDGAREGLISRIRGIRDEEIRARVAPLVEGAVHGAIQRTNAYGQAQGDPTTLAEVIVAHAQKLLTEKTGQYNQPQLSYVDRFIREEIDRTIKAELKTALDGAKAAVAAAVQSAGAEVIQQTIERMAVRS